MPNWLTDDRSLGTNLQKARDLIVRLPDSDPLSALDSINSCLESINNTEGFGLLHRLALIDLLDQAGKNPHQTLAREYVAAQRLQKSQESRFWSTCFGFTKYLGTAYVRCIEDVQGVQPRSEAIDEELPLVAGRALRALTVQIKWILQRYEVVGDRVWRELAKVYLFAENEGFAAKRAPIYPGQHGRSSAQEEFLKAMMFVVSGPDGLLAEKLHVAERIVAHYGSAFVIRPEPAVGFPFFFDLSMHKPPARAYKSISRGPMTRFFGAGEAAQALRTLAQEIKEKGTLPVDVYLGGDFDNETVLSVLAHLEECWSTVPPARGIARRALATRVTIVPGFLQTLGWLHAVQSASAIEHADPGGAESWIVYDVSDSGYGAIVPDVKTDWLQVGAVVGLRTEAASTCRVGIVRRITQDDFGQRRVGIEVVGKFAFPVKVWPAGQGAASRTAPKAEEAILLSKQPDENGQLALLLAAGRYTAAERFQIRVRDKEYLATPSMLIESGKEFDWANLKVSK